MKINKVLEFIKNVLENIPNDWLELTTHRLDIYNEELAKIEFLEKFNTLFEDNLFDTHSLKNLPTAYDYIRLGHPLSCVLEWTISKLHGSKPGNVITFSSVTIPLLGILRENLLIGKKTRIVTDSALPDNFSSDVIKKVYGYNFELVKVESLNELGAFDGSSVFVSKSEQISTFEKDQNFDFIVNYDENLGSILLINGNDKYISKIQHVRRRETITMTPADCFKVLNSIIDPEHKLKSNSNSESKKAVLETIKEITKTQAKPLVASSGLSMQYAIMMGLIHNAEDKFPGKEIKIIIPPNCYGGTNDQARRVANCLDNVDIVDLLVDSGNDMVHSLESILSDLANENDVPIIIAEIPTNPRVEVPDLEQLKNTLTKQRKTSTGEKAIDPVFVLDQTFCPNTMLVGGDGPLSTANALSYVSGSKFPSAGRCTAGYCVANDKAGDLMSKIELHLNICDNEATNFQYEILASQLPSMHQRIKDAYKNTSDFVSFIKDTLPNSKINFVSEELALEDFTPSVFSLDLPTKGDSEEEREAYKRKLNLELINSMISQIPNESKYCVSYGQLKGCYWIIPATSTQGTTKEGDKDYIARVSVSPSFDLDTHKKVFKEFVEKNELVNY